MDVIPFPQKNEKKDTEEEEEEKKEEEKLLKIPLPTRRQVLSHIFVFLLPYVIAFATKL